MKIHLIPSKNPEFIEFVDRIKDRNYIIEDGLGLRVCQMNLFDIANEFDNSLEFEGKVYAYEKLIPEVLNAFTKLYEPVFDFEQYYKYAWTFPHLDIYTSKKILGNLLRFGVANWIPPFWFMEYRDKAENYVEGFFSFFSKDAIYFGSEEFLDIDESDTGIIRHGPLGAINNRISIISDAGIIVIDKNKCGMMWFFGDD